MTRPRILRTVRKVTPTCGEEARQILAVHNRMEHGIVEVAR